MKWCNSMKKFSLLPLLLGSLLLFGCASDEVDYEKMTAEQLYNQAHDYLDETRYKKAAETFEKVELEYPYSRWATDAKIMGAYACYKNENYDDAVMALDRFIRFHPGNPNIAYAYYLKAMCYYDQISDVNREQGETRQALEAFRQLEARFPDSEYAADARQKMILARDNLAGKEMEIGRYYLNRKNYLSALNRFSAVVNHYRQTGYIEEALYRQTEIYTILGLHGEAAAAYQVLAYNYPKGAWTAKAGKIVKDGK